MAEAEKTVRTRTGRVVSDKMDKTITVLIAVSYTQRDVYKRQTENFGADTGQSSGQSGFTVVNVTDGANVDVRFVTFEFFLSHDSKPLT